MPHQTWTTMKKLLASVLALAVVFTFTVPAFATDTTPPSKTQEEFEEKLRQAGRKIAEENNLIMSIEEYEAYKNRTNTISALSEEEIAEYYKEVQATTVSLDDIYTAYPELADEALSIDELDPIYSSAAIAPLADPECGDYRLQPRYRYSERVEYDEVDSETYDGLANLTIAVMSAGLKPAQTIAVSLLQSVIPTNSWRTCKNYHVTTLYEKCSTERWGEVYTSGGLLCDTDWRGYCEASREDVYAIATAITWKGNVSYGNSSNLVRVYYEYDNVFYNTTHIKNKALELYQKAYDETFTILYGVWPSLQYVEYNWRNDYSWTNPANNPFA